jgi:hypothetical protein
MKFPCIILAALAACLLVTPGDVQAQWSPWDYTDPPDQPLPGQFLGFKSAEALVKWTGCDAPVALWATDRVNAMYSHKHKIVIFQGLRDILTDDEIAVVLLHEAGHCLHQAPDPDITSIRDAEYQAEAFAHMVLVQLGRKDADQLMRGIRLKFAALMHIDPDIMSPTHGSANSITLWARLHDGVSYPHEIQAPYFPQ